MEATRLIVSLIMASTSKLLSVASKAWFPPCLRKLTNFFPSFSRPYTLRHLESTSSGQLHDDNLDWCMILENLHQWLDEAQIQIVPYSNRIHWVILPLEHETRLGKFLFRKHVSQYEDRNDILPPTHPTVVKVQSIARKIFDVLDSDLGINGATSTMKEREVSLPWLLKIFDALGSELGISGATSTMKEREVSPPWLRQSTEHLEGIEWEVVVAREKSINASYYPGGKILVFTDRSGEFGTDADIAWTIAHEVGHAVARHAADGFNNFLLVVVAEALAMKVPLIGRLLAMVAEVLAKVPLIGTPRLRDLLKLPFGELILNWFSRRREKEADEIGMLLCASAGYDPYEVLKVFRNDRHSSLQNCFSTHPSGKARVISLSHSKIMKRALYRYELLNNRQTLPQ